MRACRYGPDPDQFPNRSAQDAQNPIDEDQKHDDANAWNEFYQRYKGMILAVALNSGLRHEEARNVVQDTMMNVAKNIATFDLSPERGSIRGWLLKMARWRVEDQRRTRNRRELCWFLDDSRSTTESASAVQQIPENRPVDFAAFCDEGWNNAFFDEVLEQLRMDVSALDYQIFYH